MDFSAFGVRDAIILAVVLVAVYLLIELLRLGRIKYRQNRAARPPKQTATETAPQDIETAPANAPPAQLSFDEQLFRSSVETELQQLHNEVGALKEMLAQLKTARAVSPQYNEAMLLAQRGMQAQSIADHCAISIGEAELVVALSRNKQEYENHDR